MISYRLPLRIEAILAGHHASPDTCRLVEALVAALIERSAEVGRSYDPSIGDTPILAGQMTSSRAHQCVARQIESGELVGDGLAIQGQNLQLRLLSGSTSVSAYSFGDGEAPSMVGSGRKRSIVHESQLQLQLVAEAGSPGEPKHLVIAYKRDLQGLMMATVGVMDSEHDFAWSTELFRRDELSVIRDSRKSSDARQGRSHDQRQVKDAELRLKRAPGKPQEK